jgi:hypothetical protein
MANSSSTRSNREKRSLASREQHRAAQEASRELDAETAALPWSPLARGVASAAILFHLSAAFVAALVASPPVSELSSAVASVFRPYVNAVDLNHGYRFFAPDPGPSHLVRYHLEFADGSKRDGQFPNLEEERPRLLYHRYFMLSEKLFGLYGVVREIEERSKEPLPPEALQDLKMAKQTAEQRYQAFARSYGNELLRRTGAKRVTLELVEHLIAQPEMVVAGRRLDDPALYFVRDTLGPFGEGGVPEAIP